VIADKKVPPGTKIYGGPVGTVGRQSNRYYTIGAEKLTWAVVMLQEGEWFDDGICLCGAVSLRVFVPDGGCLRAYDLLEDGRIKKMQVLGAGQRVQVFEWTHLPMTQGPEDLALLKTTCLQQLKSCPGGDWNSWVHVARELHGGGWKEPALGPLIAARFLDENVVVNFAAILLDDLNPPETQKLVAKRIRLSLDGAAKPDAIKDRYLQDSPYGDLHNLLCQVKREKQRQQYIREGLAHVHPAVRRDAYYWLDRLPADEATLAAALKGLADDDPYIRRNAAEDFSERLGKRIQVPALRRFLETEKDKEIRDLLGKAIERIEAEP
jgi:hypothetical protein